MATISTAKRKSLRGGQFALPGQRKYPIHDAAHVRNAAARLEQNKGELSPAEYAEAKGRIAAAAKRFGVKSEYAKRSSAPRKRGLRMRINTDGSMEVHHLMAELKDTFFGPSIACADLPESGPVWRQIAYVGSWKGHPSGAFSITEKDLDDIVRNADRLFGAGQEIPLDYEHASEADPTDGAVPTKGAPAQGWFKKLERRGDELWGLVDFNEQAREQIKAKEYRYFSPAIRFGARDKVSGQPIGARLTSVALTNRPFLDGLPAIAARDFDAEPITEQEAKDGVIKCSWLSDWGSSYDMPQLRKALRLGDDLAGPDEMLARCMRLRDMYTSAGESHMCDGVNMNDITKDLADVARMPMHVDVFRVLDAIEDFIQGLLPPDDDDVEYGQEGESTATAADRARTETHTMDTITLTEHNAKVAELQLKLKDAESKVETLETECKQLKDAAAKQLADTRTARIDEAFATYKDVKKLTDDDKTAMAVVLSSNPELFEKLYPRKSAQAPRIDVKTLSDRITPPVTNDPPAKFQRPTFKALCDKHMKDGKSLDDATVAAYEEIRTLTGSN